MRTQTSPKAELFAHALRTVVLGVFAVVAFACVTTAVTAGTAVAAPTSTINFQARLETAAGAIAPDGNYNVEFKLYNTSSGGTAEWTEDYTYNSGAGSTDARLRVVNGYLTVSLGSLCAFSTATCQGYSDTAPNWNQQQWLTMNIGGTGSTGSFPSMGDGEMSPRIQLTAVPYAFTSGSISATDGSGHIGTLSFPTNLVNAVDSIALPDASGTVCLQGSSACGFATGSGAAFVQGGNNFGANAVLGTTGAGQTLALQTAGTQRVILDASGNLQFLQASTLNVAGAATGSQLAIQGGAATTGTNVGGNLLLQGGAGASTGASGSVIVKPASNDSTTAFQVQNAAGTTLLMGDTSNMRVVVNQGNLDIIGIGVVSGVSITAGANQSGTLSGGSAYYYQVSAVTPSGETVPSTEATVGANGSTSFTPLTPPGPATLALTTGTNLGVGTYKYSITFETNHGQTTGGTEATITTTSGNQAVSLTNIPIGPAGTTWRWIYRTKVGGASGTEQLVALITDNTTSTYSDTTRDSSLQSNVLPTSNTATTDTNTVTVNWTAVPGATSYKIYRATASGAENMYFTSATNTYTDNGSTGTAGSGVATDTTQRLGIGTESPRANLDVLGSAIIQTPVDSSTAFQVQNASGSAVLAVDTTQGTLNVYPSGGFLDWGSNLLSGDFSVAGGNWTGVTNTSCGTAGWYVGTPTQAQHCSGNFTALATSGLTLSAGTDYYLSFRFTGPCGGTNDYVNVRLGDDYIGRVYARDCGSTLRFAGGANDTTGLAFIPSSGWTGTLSALPYLAVVTSEVTPALAVHTSDGSTTENTLQVRATPGGIDASLYIGNGSGQFDEGWDDNTAFGIYALQNTVNGSYNTAVGNGALSENISGWDNVAVGAQALVGVETGHENVALGTWALTDLQQGSGNVALGEAAFERLSISDYNTALGYSAGNCDSNGQFCTSDALQNATAIGAYTQVQASNSIVLGSVDTVTKVGIGITVPSNTFSVSPLDYQAGTATRTNGSATLVGTGTTWTSSMIGDIIVFADGTTTTIAGFTDATHITMAASYTGTTDASSVYYRFHKAGLQVTSTGNAYIRSGSASAFQVQDAGGTAVLNTDTTNRTVTVRSGNDIRTLGSELYSGNFSSGWTTTGWNVSGGTTAAHNIGNTSSLINTNVPITAGITYVVSFVVNGTCATINAGEWLNVYIGGTNIGTVRGADCDGSTLTFVGVAGSTAGLTFSPTTNWPSTVSGISIKALSGAINPVLIVQNNAGSASIEVRANSDTTSTYIGLTSGSNDIGGYENTALGLNTLQSNLNGSDNTALGAYALQHTSYGFNNTAVGTYTLYTNTNGNYNAAFGDQALYANTTGSLNTAIGEDALTENTSGGNNTAVGNNSLFNSKTGSYNTALGDSALQGNISGSFNIGVGYTAGGSITSGSNNAFLGYRAGYQDANNFFSTTSNLQNATAIGAYAQVQASNSIVLGGVDTATNVGVGITVPSNTFSVSPIDYQTGTACTVASSGSSICQGAGPSATFLFGSGTSWTSSMVGDIVIFADGTTTSIASVTDSTHLTLAGAVDELSGSYYRFHHIGLQVTSAGTVSIGSASTGDLLNVGGSAGEIAKFATGSGNADSAYVSIAGGRTMLGYDGSGNTVLQGASGKNIQLAVNNNTFGSGTVGLTVLNTNGYVGIGNTTPGSPLQVSNVATTNTPWVKVDGSLTAVPGGFPAGILSQPSYAGTGTQAGFEAVSANAILNGSGTISNLFDLVANPQVAATATGSIATSTGIYIRTDNNSAVGGTIGTSYGIHIAGPITTGTITNNYAFVTDTAAGNVGIGDTSPTETLSLNTSSGNNVVGFYTNGTVQGFVGVSNSVGGVIGGSSVGDLMLRTQAHNVLISTNSGTSSQIKIDTSGDLQFQQASTISAANGTLSGNQLTIQAGGASGAPAGANLLLQAGAGTLTNGMVLVKASASAGTIFQVQNSSSTAILSVVPGTNPQIKVGAGSTGEATPSLLVLDGETGSTADPAAEVDGAMYYNASTQSYRCGVNGFWAECSINDIQYNYDIEDEFLGGSVGAGSLAGVGGLGWNVTQGTSCTTQYNQTAGSHDHPGTISLVTGAASADLCNMAEAGTAAGAAAKNNVVAAGDVMRTTVEVSAVNQGVFRAGIENNNVNSVAPTSGAWFEYNNASDATHWRYCYANNAAATCASTTTVTVSATTWYQLEIRFVSTTAITFTIRQLPSGTPEVHALTGITYDAGSTNKLTPVYLCDATTTAAYTCSVDYFQWQGVITTSGGR